MGMSDFEVLVLSHKNCDDGKAAAFAAYSALGERCRVVFCDYSKDAPWQQEVLALGGCQGRTVYFLDYCPTAEQLNWVDKQQPTLVVWLDHHRSSFQACGIAYPSPQERYVSNLPGRQILLDNSKSGCILAWEHFHPSEPVPTLLRYIDDKDRWQHSLLYIRCCTRER